MKVIVAYVPVIHQGYLRFFQQTGAEQLYILGKELQLEYPHLRKDVRALEPDQIKTSLEALKLGFSVQILAPETFTSILGQNHEIFMPDEDIMRQLAERHFTDENIQFKSVFLRWDTQSSLAEKTVAADQTIKMTAFMAEMIGKAEALAEKSGDWWRQVGAVIVQNGEIVTSGFNQHVPNQQVAYEMGDPRGSFHRGSHLDKSTSIHAEGIAIAEAARKGISLEGAELFVTTFPCPYCAKLVAYSGIKTVYFTKGYAMVDGESILKDQEVEIVKVS